MTGAYSYFNSEYVKTLRENDQSLTHTEAMKLAGTKWGLMTEMEKAPYEKKAAQDKVRNEQ